MHFIVYKKSNQDEKYDDIKENWKTLKQAQNFVNIIKFVVRNIFKI